MKTANCPEQSLVRKIDFSDAAAAGSVPQLLRREWLVTNGLGGYASATISGAVTWRYHGLLIAALPSPIGRTLMLNHLEECLYLPDRRLVQFGGIESVNPEEAKVPTYVTEFRLDNHMPVWRYDIRGMVIEKRLVM